VYFGGWKTFDQRVNLDGRFLLDNLPARAENGLGLQLWLNTPAHGTRIGAGYLTWQLESSISPSSERNRWRSWHLSLDVARERWLLRSELRRWDFEQDLGAFFGGPSFVTDAEREGSYLQAGGWLTPKLGLFGQWEEISLTNDDRIATLEDFHCDLALSVNYRFSTDLMLKAEFHHSDTFFPLGIGEPPPGPNQMANQVDWAIIGLSLDF